MKFLLSLAVTLLFNAAAANAQTPLAIRFGAAIQACGLQSPNTVPDHWQSAMVRGGAPGSRDCYVWIPPPWQSSYFGEGGNLFWDGQQGYTASLVFNGVPTGIQECSPRGYTAWYLAFAGQGCANPQLESYEESITDIAGLRVPTAKFSYSCTKNGVAEIGGVTAFVPTPTTGFCSTAAYGFAQPQAEIGPATCVAAQVVASNKCRNPQGQLCEKPAASAWCKSNGFPLGGYCDSFEQYKCIQ